MANQTEQNKPGDFGARSTGPHVSLQDISEQGAYVCHWSGDLLRVTEKEIPVQKPPNLLENAENLPLETTKISEDPFVPISKARFVAANYDIDINF